MLTKIIKFEKIHVGNYLGRHFLRKNKNCGNANNIAKGLGWGGGNGGRIITIYIYIYVCIPPVGVQVYMSPIQACRPPVKSVAEKYMRVSRHSCAIAGA